MLFKLLSSTLNIDKSSATLAPKPRDQGRTAAEFRAAQREKKKSDSTQHPSTPIILKKGSGSRRKGLLSQAIIEEEDSDF